jgi:hypothetical protein
MSASIEKMRNPSPSSRLSWIPFKASISPAEIPEAS